MTVHDVEMDPVGAGFLDPLYFVGEAGEVCGEDGGSNEDFSHEDGSMSNEGMRKNTLRPTLNSNTEADRAIRQLSLDDAESVSRYYPISAGRIAL